MTVGQPIANPYQKLINYSQSGSIEMKPLQILLISAPLVLAGCSSLKVTPATEHATSGEVCITPDMSGRKVAYQCTIKALQNKGFTVREVSQAECRDCRVVLHCQTTSRWDLANFTSDINYEWIEDGKTIAKAKYRECQDFCVWGGYSRGSPTRLPFVFCDAVCQT